MAPPPIGIIGTGRVARALALGLGGSGDAPPLIWGRNHHALRRAAEETGALAADDLATLARSCACLVLAVSDDALGAVVADLARVLPCGANSFVFHVSGRSGAALLAPLREKGALTAALHPAMTFTGDPQEEVRRMAGARFAVTGSSEEAAERARQIARRLGGIPVDIAEAHRPLYHAALCHAANHLVTLLAGAARALAAAGVDEPGALMAPLVRAALENSLNQGFAALSGPLLRGDVETVQGHLAALAGHNPELLGAYRAMAVATLEDMERHAMPTAAPLGALLGRGDPAG